MASKEQSGYPSPLVFTRNLRPGVLYPVDGIPIDAFTQLNDVRPSEIGTTMVQALDHFNLYQGPLVAATLNGYTVVGTGTPIAKIVPTRQKGVIGLDTSAAGADSNTLRQEGMTVVYDTSRLVVYAAKLNLQVVATTALLAGLANSTDTVVTLPTDGLFFAKSAVGTELEFHVRAGGTSSVQTLPLTLVDAQDVIVAFRVEAGGITPYVKDVSAESWVEGVGVPSTDANIPVSVDMLQHMGIENGTAASSTLELDYQYVAEQE